MEVKICSNKTCHLVGIQQNIDKFSKNKNKKDGLQYRCKECCKNDQKNASPEQKEKQRARHRIINMTPKQIENTRERHRKENLTPEQIASRNKIYRHRNYEKNKQNPAYVEARKKRAREWYWANKEKALKRMNEYHTLHRPYKTYEQKREYYLKYTESKVTYRRKPYGPRKLKEK